METMVKVLENTAIVEKLGAPLSENLSGSISLLEDDTTMLTNSVNDIQGRIDAEEMKINGMGGQVEVNGDN